ncbi:carboxymuconolactone decarboxylase family protein [Rhabdothermincola salaria]|uniref:carboxymuconolactone decarboxylase family protein n=1 Tax=Rhabdothermincola salaria TaxID=2903142 RepID=UPI001E568124|nr:hypothetical protein [Rhabdothermincola salaria]MCD9624020.1 hypothetical protein [Rhabdothermincola salaria]
MPTHQSTEPSAEAASAPRSGIEALTVVAHSAGGALSTMVDTAWAAAAAADRVDLVDLATRAMARPHGLAPLPRPTRLGPSPWSSTAADDWRRLDSLADTDRAVVAFAEQMSLDVSAIDDTHRAAVGAALGPATGDVVQALWVFDYVPRVRSALDALFGAAPWEPFGAEPWPEAPPGSSAADIWSAIDAYIRIVPRLDALDPVVTELVRLRGARQHQCRLCQSLRSRPALRAGAGDEQFAAVDHHADSELPAATKAALALTDAIVWLPGRIDPAVAASVRDELTDAQAVELVLDVARNATNKIAVAFAADAPHVDEGYEIYEIDPDGEAVYGLSLDEEDT